MGASVLLISGSVRAGSVNAAVIATAAELVARPTIAHIYASLGELPHFNPDLDHDPLPPRVAELRAAIGGASALLFSTPEYAGALPGALKNLLEWTVGGVEISDKPIGWINPSTSPLRAAGTYACLKTVLDYTGAAVIGGACIDLPVPRTAVGADGLIRDKQIRQTIAATISALTQARG